jgi:hypothetical protein
VDKVVKVVKVVKGHNGKTLSALTFKTGRMAVSIAFQTKWPLPNKLNNEVDPDKINSIRSKKAVEFLQSPFYLNLKSFIFPTFGVHIISVAHALAFSHPGVDFVPTPGHLSFETID